MGLTQPATKIWQIPEPAPAYIPEATPVEEPAPVEPAPAVEREPVEVPA